MKKAELLDRITRLEAQVHWLHQQYSPELQERLLRERERALDDALRAVKEMDAALGERLERLEKLEDK